MYTGGLETEVWLDLLESVPNSTKYEYQSTFWYEVIPASEDLVPIYKRGDLSWIDRSWVVRVNAENSAGVMTPICNYYGSYFNTCPSMYTGSTGDSTDSKSGWEYYMGHTFPDWWE